MQRAYINTLYHLMGQDKNIVAILSDSGTDYDKMMMADFPEQYINIGIAEQNAVGLASGLAIGGKIPFVFTNGSFLAYRAYEFIRNDVCLQNTNVKIIGMGSGLSISELGPTHHTTEDIAALRAIPNLTVLSPSSPLELSGMMRYAASHAGPVYIRMGMGGERELYPENYEFSIDRHNILSEGEDACLITTGSIASEALDAVSALNECGYSIKLVHVPALKPFSRQSFLSETGSFSKLVSLEEHNIHGGLGSILAEIIAELGLPVRLKRIGLNDCFAKGYGAISELRLANHLDAASIAASIKEFLINE